MVLTKSFTYILIPFVVFQLGCSSGSDRSKDPVLPTENSDIVGANEHTGESDQSQPLPQKNKDKLIEKAEEASQEPFSLSLNKNKPNDGASPILLPINSHSVSELSSTQILREVKDSRLIAVFGELEELVEISDSEVNERLNAHLAFPDEQYMPNLSDKFVRREMDEDIIDEEVLQLTEEGSEIFKRLEVVREDKNYFETINEDKSYHGKFKGKFTDISSNGLSNNYVLTEDTDGIFQFVENCTDLNSTNCSSSFDDLPKLKRVPIFELNDGLIDAKIIDQIYEDDKGRSWIVSRTSGLYVKFENSENKHAHVWQLVPNLPTTSIAFDKRDKNFYLGHRVQIKALAEPGSDESSKKAEFLRKLEFNDNIALGDAAGYNGISKMTVSPELSEEALNDCQGNQECINKFVKVEFVQGFSNDINSLSFFNDKLFIATFNDSLWQYDTCPVPKLCDSPLENENYDKVHGKWGIWKGFPGSQVHKLSKVNEDLLLVSFDEYGTFHINKENKELKPVFSVGNYNITKGALEYAGDILIATENHLIIYDKNHFDEEQTVNIFETDKEKSIKEQCEKQKHPMILVVNKQHLGFSHSTGLRDIKTILDNKYLAISNADGVMVTTEQRYKELKKILYEKQYLRIKKEMTDKCVEHFKHKEEQGSYIIEDNMTGTSGSF